MLAHLKMPLEGDGLSYRTASRLQGVLMETIDMDYADMMHVQQIHPYSQYLTLEDGIPVWHVNTLNRAAYDNIIIPLMEREASFRLHRTDGEVRILDRQLGTMDASILLDEFYSGNAPPFISVEFLTPTSFKQNGRYMVLPDIRLLCQSLMQKYSAASGQFDMMDVETLEQMSEGLLITRHRIRSLLFPLEGTAVPGFVGNIGIRCLGTRTMACYLRLLLRFGEFSGIGVKTGMGMGAIRIHKPKEVDK